MSNRAGSKGLMLRLIVLVALGAAAMVIAKYMKSPLAISESEVQTMVKQHELIGMTLGEAAKKLQHTAPNTTDGSVIFDFKQVKGWRGGAIRLDVVSGKVTAATWVDPNAPVEEE